MFRRIRRGPLPAVFTVAVPLATTPFDLYQHYAVPGGAAAALGLVAAVPAGLSLRHPRLAVAAVLLVPLVVAGGLTPVSRAEGWPLPVSFTFLLVIVFARTSSQVPPRLIAGALAGLGVAVAAWGLAFPARFTLATSVVGVGATAGVSVIQVLRRDRDRTRTDLLAERRTVLEERERRLLLQERARIARELHDVVGHHLSVIAVKAGSAPYRHRELPPDLEAELESIAQNARDGLHEARALTALLRDDGREFQHPPQVRLVDLPALITQSGVAVTWSDLEQLELPAPADPAVEVVLYRVTQEALSNVLRHGSSPEAQLTLTHDADGVGLCISSPSAAGTAVVPGHGLTGMRERVEALGGTFDAGYVENDAGPGTFVVSARLPLDGRGAA